MGLGSTAKKIQTLAERAEQLYSQMMELRDQIRELRERVERTDERIEHLDVRNAKQWALLKAIAEEQGIDVDEVLTAAAIEEVEARQGDDEEAADEEELSKE